MAAGLHDMLATMLAALPWDENAHAVAYRHMPEVRALPKSTVLFQAAVMEAKCGRSDGQSRLYGGPCINLTKRLYQCRQPKTQR